jgi:hypothetical protein
MLINIINIHVVTPDFLKDIFLNSFGPMPLFHFFNTQTTHIKSKTQNSIVVFFYKHYTLTGFEPGSAVSEAAAMSTAPCARADYNIA